MRRTLEIKEKDVDVIRFYDGFEKLSDGVYKLDLMDSFDLYDLLDSTMDDSSFLELVVDFSNNLVTVHTYLEDSDNNEDIVLIGIGAKKLLEKVRKFIENN